MRKESLRILQVIAGEGRAGSAISALLLSRELVKMGHTLYVWCYPKSHTEYLAKKWRLHTYTFFPKPPYIKEAKELIRFCKEHGVDIVNAHHTKDRIVCMLAKLLGLKIPLILTRRNMPGSMKGALFLQQVLCDKIISISGAIRERLLKEGVKEEKIEVVHIGVDVKLLEEEVEKESLEKGHQKLIGLVGHFYKGRKGHDLLMDAFHYIKEECRLLFLGIEWRELAPLLKEKRIRKKSVIHKEFLDNPYPFYRLMDVFTYPSRSEGLGLALLEVMALGIPVVASDISPIKEVIKDGENGLLFESGNPYSLAEKINLLLHEPVLAQRLSQRAKETIKEEFTIQKCASRTEKVYLGVIEG